jgi:hypothetical protein
MRNESFLARKLEVSRESPEARLNAARDTGDTRPGSASALMGRPPKDAYGCRVHTSAISESTDWLAVATRASGSVKPLGS